MAVSTDPLQREQIGVAVQDTGARLRAPSDNSLLALSQSLTAAQPALADTLGNITAQDQKDAEKKAQVAALQTSGAKLADAVRQGLIKPTQNPWFIQAYNREAASLRATDQLSQLQVQADSWQEKNDPAAFAQRWHTEVANIAKDYSGDPDEAAGFLPAQAQASQQVLATNQAYNSKRISDERFSNVGSLAADALQRQVQASGGHISGSGAWQALQSAKENWIATGGSIDDWNKIAISAVTTASYSLRSPHLLDLLYDPALLSGPRENDSSSYGDGVDPQTPDLPAPLKPVVDEPAAQAAPPTVSATAGNRLVPPALGRVTNTFAQHQARGSAGVDIAVPVGTQLTTPIGGTAEVGFQKGKGGLFVKIVSPDGKTQQVLAHLSLASVQNGQQVAPGTVIGRSGQSGDATGPHVHWQLKVDGQQVDPLSYRVEHTAPAQDQEAAVAAGDAAPTTLAPPAPAVQTTPAPLHPSGQGPSLADVPGVAEQTEQARFDISRQNSFDASNRLQAITDQRRLASLDASDRLYATFGTKLLSGDVSEQTIIKTLSAANYSPQVIAGAIDNIQNAVSTSATMANARTVLQAAPGTPGAKNIFDTETEGRVNGYSAQYEQRVAGMVAGWQITADDGARWIGEAVSRSESLQAQGRAATEFKEAQADRGTPGTLIKKAGDVRRGIDAFTSQAVILAQRYAQGAGGFTGTGTLSPATQRVLKSTVTNATMSWLADHPNDWAGAEQAGRDQVARFLQNLVAQHQNRVSRRAPAAAASPGSNPRGG